MKTNYLKYTPVLLVALFATGNAAADSFTSDAGVIKWAEGPAGTLTNNPGASLASILAGNSALPGGNIELGTIIDNPSSTMTNAQFDANTLVSTLTVNLAGGDIVFSSLTAADWASGLLTQWSTDLINTYAPGTDLATFEATFVGLGGRQRLSDPNISYVNPDGTFGLAGFLNAKLAPDLPAAIRAVIPDGAQISEIAKVTYQGNTSYAYRMGNGTATPSHVQTADGSYNGNFNIPEPTELALLAAGLTGFLGFRRKAVRA
jgi:hypothetical protein